MGSGQSKKGGPEPVKSIEYKNNPEATVRSTVCVRSRDSLNLKQLLRLALLAFFTAFQVP